MPRILALIGVLLCLPADEVEQLLADVQAPSRYASHVPAFTLEEFEHGFTTDTGTDRWSFFALKDGGRYVAYVPKNGFHGGSIFLLTHDPAQAPGSLPLPTERFHIDNAPGASFRTDHFLPDENGSKNWGHRDDSTWTIAPDGRSVTLVRRFSGSAAFNKWEQSTKGKELKVDHVGTFVLRCDPVFGYTIEGQWATGLDQVQTGQYVSVYPPGMSNPWSTELHQRVALCSTAAPGWIGHANNHPCIDVCDAGGGWSLRDGGFVAYLDRERGWSWVGTLDGGNAKLSVCNVHADQDLCVSWPKDLIPGTDGLIRHTVRSRLLRLPPEATNKVWDGMELRHGEGRMTVIPVGRLCDFDDQPYSTAEHRIGMTFGNGGGADLIAVGAGRPAADGQPGKALRVSGSVFPNLPQVVTRPGHRYRIEGWYRVEAATLEARAAIKARFDKDEADRLPNWQKAVAKAEKQGKPLPPEPPARAWVEPGPAEAFITAHYYRWTPHNGGDRVLEQTTSKAQIGDWQRVELEFTAPAWGPFIDVRFVCTHGGMAYLDDFMLVDLGATP